ncbi:dipeptide/oligopeptide/nickel ABC transporter ATP-binding protein [Chromatiales bacterium (ex Bugula neritina AB1)]|nr:dipeptide/oligopeptide/nickel ABC transporter ATP-binding protein [Chromatiales bacterium (ex Bugula neritina AB1)]
MSQATQEPLISVENLSIRFRTGEGLVTAVDNVSFDIAAGEVLGLVGESGSGKSVTAKSLMLLNAENAVYGENSRITINTGEESIEVLQLKRPQDRKQIRGGLISMIFQEPMASFAPAMSVGSQMVEQLQIHTSMTKAEAKEHSIDMLDRVGISDASKRFKQYAFEFSGGMRQRAMIAMALSTKPRLLIADEPTTALDVTIQAQVIDLMLDLVEEFKMGILFITHDLGVIAQTADRVAVMYLGTLLETGPVRPVIRTPSHPYTQGLINALPRLDDLDAPLTPIPGDIPSPLERPAGCVFHTRCAQALADHCNTVVPSVTEVEPGHKVACVLRQPASSGNTP